MYHLPEPFTPTADPNVWIWVAYSGWALAQQCFYKHDCFTAPCNGRILIFTVAVDALVLVKHVGLDQALVSMVNDDVYPGLRLGFIPSLIYPNVQLNASIGPEVAAVVAADVLERCYPGLAGARWAARREWLQACVQNVLH